MKKVFIAAALAAMIVSCGSKGNKSAEMIAESESDSLLPLMTALWAIYKPILTKAFYPALTSRVSTICSLCKKQEKTHWVHII